MANRVEKLDYAERWFGDGIDVVQPPGAIISIEANMSEAKALRSRLAEEGMSVTYTHLLIRAVASALTRHADLHRAIAGNMRLFPDTIDICLSISGEMAVTPVLILKDAGRMTLDAIAREVRSRTGEARKEAERLYALLRRWGWVVPLAFLRRAILRTLLNRAQFRRQVSGTFQITVVPTVDTVVPLRFNTTGIVAAGAVCERAVVVDGRIVARPTIRLVCCFDHKVWNGMDGARFLNAVREELERPEAAVRSAETLRQSARAAQFGG